MPSVSKGALWTIYLVILLDMLNFGIVFPLLPSIAHHFNATATEVGSLATSFSIAQVLCTPILGRASDRFGRRPVLLLAIAGTTASAAMTGLAQTFPMLLLARVINGASGGTAGIANAYIADVTTAEEKPTYISYLQAANSIGIIVGPALGGVFSHWGFSIACYASAGLSAFNFVVGLIFLTESRSCQARDVTVGLNSHGATPSAGEATPSGNAAAVDHQAHRIPPSAFLLYASGFLFALGFAAFETVTGYYLMDTFFDGDAQVSGQFYGSLFVVAGVSMFVVAAFFYKPLMRLLGERLLILVGLLLRTAGFIGMPLSPTPVAFACACVVQVCGSNLIMPTTSSMLTTLCSREVYGRALGYSQAFQAVARVVAPTMFGQIYDKVTHTFSFYATAAAGVVGVILIMLVPRSTHVEDVAEEAAANAAVFERQDSMPLPGDVTPYQPGLVRSNSQRLSRSTSARSIGTGGGLTPQACGC